MSTGSLWNWALPWIEKREFRLLLAILAAYAVVLFGLHGEAKPFCDNPGYVDPAINYVTGHGFTSTCWYAQGGSEFWAGNVPLFQFLAIPWFKVFGVSHSALLWLNFVFAALGMVLLWRGMVQSGFVRSASARLAVIAFLLSTDSSSYLLTFGRYDPLGFLLCAAAAACLAEPNPTLRYGGLFVSAALLPWAHPAAAVLTGVLGGLLLLFYPKRFWKEVFVFGAGGAAGTVALVAFYHHFGVWDAFLKSISPHTVGSTSRNEAGFLAHRKGGLTQTFLLPAVALAMSFFLVRGILRKDLRFPLFSTVAMVAIPFVLYETGVFSLYYAWMLLFPMGCFLFALLSRETLTPVRLLQVAAFIVLVGVIVPGSLPRKAVKNRLLIHREGDPLRRMEAFAAKTVRSSDTGWINEELYYVLKPKLHTVFTSPVVFSELYESIAYPGQEEDLASVTVCIWSKEHAPVYLRRMPGQWKWTGEALRVWGTDFVVYRRVD